MLLDGEPKIVDKLSHERMYSWYFTREELEKLSPSRKDGISESKESEIRYLYCSFIRDVGMRLKLPQMTIATAIMFCHRFYLHQSLAKNGWQTIATVCVFLASKVEDTPCPLDLVVRVGYETMYRRDPITAQRIRQNDVFDKQKALILIGERLVLTTIRFDFNIQHPYRPLHDAMKNLGIIQKEVKQVAWNFVNDWLRTTLCLQFKPQYIAAGSLYLAAKVHNIKLPLHGPHVWWHQFDVAPKLLEAVIKQLMEHVSLNKLMSARPSPVKQKEAPSEATLIVSNSPDSVLNQSSLLTSNSSPDISEPNDHMHVHSGQYLINSHTADCRISGPDSSSLSVGSNRDTASKDHDKESLDQDDGLMSCRNQTSLDTMPATEGNTECMKPDVSHCNDSCAVNGDNRNQASRNQRNQLGDGVDPFLEVISLNADMDRRKTQPVELAVANSNCCTDSLNADIICSDRILANAATGTVDGAPSALPVEIEVDHLHAELKKVDVARIKDLLMKRKKQRDIQVHVASEDLSEEAWIERELESGIVTKKEADRAATSEELNDEAWIERELESGIVVGPSNKQVITLDGLSEDDWIERELESGIIVESAPARKKQKLESSC